MVEAGRLRAWHLVAAAAVLVVVAGCGLTGQHDGTSAAPVSVSDTGQAVTDEPTVEATEEPTEEPTVEPTTPSPKPKKTSKSPTAKPKPSHATPTGPVNNFQAAACFDYDGKAISKAKAKAALNAAAAKHYWPSTAPDLVVPADLVRSVAWNESGWQSNVVNCDGGRGLMQVMPGTVSQMNDRFEQSYDVNDYRQNAMLGANYLAWATVYLGDLYFGHKYDLSTGKCTSNTSWCLLNVVIAAYHAGVGTVEANASSKTVPSPQYVDTTRSLMKSCFCDQY
jgi:hypothetical protein